MLLVVFTLLGGVGHCFFSVSLVSLLLWIPTPHVEPFASVPQRVGLCSGQFCVRHFSSRIPVGQFPLTHSHTGPSSARPSVQGFELGCC